MPTNRMAGKTGADGGKQAAIHSAAWLRLAWA